MSKLVTYTSTIPRLLRKLPATTGENLMKAGLFVEGEAKKRTPVDTGRLRSSITTKNIRPGTVVVGTNVEYAVFVHERTDVTHVTGEAKFLENAINKNTRDIENIIRTGYRKVMNEAAD